MDYLAKNESMLDDDNGNNSDGQGGSATAGDKEQKGKRRTRNDPDSRNFTCGCGKSYLSYAALYTHIKTKHEGIPPNGTSQPNNNGKPGRGRPKKDDSAAKTKDDDKSDEESIDPTRNLVDFIDYLTKLGNVIRYDNNQESDNSIINTGQPPKLDAVKYFPSDLFPPQSSESQPIVNELTAIKKSGSSPLHEETDPNSELKQTKLNKIFAIFLSQLAPHLTSEFYRELCLFIVLYRKTLNDIGWQVKANVTGKDNAPNSTKLEFCENNNGEYAPDVCNEFITDTMPNNLHKYDLKGFKVIGLTTDHTRNAVFLTQYLCNWLNANKYTNSRLSINPDGGQS
jgi:hypothetical protein